MTRRIGDIHGISVIKVGGRPQADAELASVLARRCRAEPGATVLVHGGGDDLSRLQRALGSEPRFVDGLRVTSESDLQLVRMALSGVANKQLVAALAGRGLRAIGLSGEDGSLITANPIDPERLGYVGAPHSINTAVLRLLMNDGYLPVVSPVSASSSPTLGPALNVNGDDAAVAIAVAMEARDLLFVTDVAGVLCGGTVLGEITPESAATLLFNGDVKDGMRAKLRAALAAVERGIDCVRIGDISAIADPTRGTLLTRTGALT